MTATELTAAIAAAVDAALGEVARQQGGIVRPVATEARGVGIGAGEAHLRSARGEPAPDASSPTPTHDRVDYYKHSPSGLIGVIQLDRAILRDIVSAGYWWWEEAGVPRNYTDAQLRRLDQIVDLFDVTHRTPFASPT